MWSWKEPRIYWKWVDLHLLVMCIAPSWRVQMSQWIGCHGGHDRIQDADFSTLTFLTSQHRRWTKLNPSGDLLVAWWSVDRRVPYKSIFPPDDDPSLTGLSFRIFSTSLLIKPDHFHKEGTVLERVWQDHLGKVSMGRKGDIFLAYLES